MSDDLGNMEQFEAPNPRPVAALESEDDHYLSIFDIGTYIDETDEIDSEDAEKMARDVTRALEWVQSTSRITKVQVVNSFEDDHIDCYDLILTNQDNESIGLSFWWIDDMTSILQDIQKGKVAGYQELLGIITSELSEYI